jgi:sulfatase maturation enzyme AslB (radical SAM superfamily)
MSLSEAWNDPYFRKLRADMLTEKVPEQCSKCHKLESYGKISRRMEFNSDFSSYYDETVLPTLPDGTAPEMKLRYQDFRWSNICNLRCRMCMPLNSTSLYDDFRKVYGDQPHPKTITLESYHPSVKAEIFSQLKYSDVIYFAGGEPLIMDQHYEVLEELLRLGRQDDIYLVYNTNMTHTGYKGKSALDLWARFKNVEVFGSVDAVGERGEYLRLGSSWERIKENREAMKKTCPHINFFITPTVSLMNALHLPELYLTCMREALIKPENFRIYFLFDPYFFSAQLLPAEIKQQLTQVYDDLIKKVTALTGNSGTTNGFMSVRNFVNQEDKSGLLPEFRKHIRKFDEAQESDFAKTFPELSSLLID